MYDPSATQQPPQPPPAPPTQPFPPPAPQRPPENKPESWAWVGGAVLIVIGLAVLLGNFGVMWGNWWVLLFYLFAAVNFANAGRSWQRTGVFGKQAAGSLTGGLVLTAIGSIFLLDLAWDLWWPLILVAVGVGIVAGALLGGLTGAQRT